MRYGITHEEADYLKFLEFMKVSAGDHKARLELSKENPDFKLVRQALLEGRNHPDDIDGTIKLFRRFHSNYYINRAINAWTKKDAMGKGFIVIAQKLHTKSSALHRSRARK